MAVRRSNLPARLVAGAFVVVLGVGCLAEQPPVVSDAPGTGSTEPSPGFAADGTSPASDSPGPDATHAATPVATLDADATPWPQADRPPLPDPALNDPLEIAEAIANPQTRAQGVVSMLKELGIGIYRNDGSAIRAGDERQSDDVWLYEDEVYALIDMAAYESRRDVISFAEWHAGLRELGLQISARELASVYDEVYFSDVNGSFFVDLISALGVYFDPENVLQTYLSRLQAWLLFLDGFVVGTEESVGGTGPIAMVGPMIVAQEDQLRRWGGASAKLPRLLSDTDLPIDLAAAVSRLETMTRSVPLLLSPDHQKVHEGHGRAGSPADFLLTFRPWEITYLTPFGDDFFLLPSPSPAGLPIRWDAAIRSVLAEHGEMRDQDGADPFGGPTVTRADGSAELIYTPKAEEAKGEGETVSDVVTISATTDVHEVARRTWQVPQVLLHWLQAAGGTMSAQAASSPLGFPAGARLEIEWHELRGLRIDMTDEYDVSFEFPRFRGAEMSLGKVRRIGTDHFAGFLAEQDDGTWRGIVRGTTDSQWKQESPFGACGTQLAGAQDLLVIAESSAYQRPGDKGLPIALRFFPVLPPEITHIGCDYELNRWIGPDPDDPEVDPAMAVPSEYYAPFNDQRIIEPLEVGFPTGRPSQPGSVTNVYDEHAEGLGGGTWTVTVELVEPTH